MARCISAISVPRPTSSRNLRRYFASTEKAGRERCASIFTRKKRPHPTTEAGTFTPWEEIPSDTDMLFYEGLHGAIVTETVNVAQHADLLIGVVPVINLEWIQKLHRDKMERGYTQEAIVDTILRRMPDYINYICPQFSQTHVNFQRVPDRRHVESIHRA